MLRSTKTLVLALLVIALAGCAPTMKDLPKLEVQANRAERGERLAAVREIGRISDPSPTLLPILLRALKDDSSSDVRAEAARSLGNLRLPGSFDPLRDALDKDPESDVRAASAGALFAVAPDKSFDALARSAAGDDAPSVREVAVRLIGKTGQTRARQVVSAALRKDPSPDVRTQAARSLGESGWPDAIEPLSDAYHEETNVGVAAVVVEAVGKIRGDRAMDLLVDALDRAETREAAIDAIANNNRGGESRKVVALLLPQSRMEKDPDARVIQIFIDSGDPRVRPELVDALASGGVSVEQVERIVVFLQGEEDRHLVPELMVRLTRAKGTEARRGLVRALGLFRDSRPVPMLVDLIERNPEDAVVVQAIEALDRIGDSRAAPILCRVKCLVKEKSTRDAARAAVANHPEWFRKRPTCEEIDQRGCRE